MNPIFNYYTLGGILCVVGLGLLFLWSAAKTKMKKEGEPVGVKKPALLGLSIIAFVIGIAAINLQVGHNQSIGKPLLTNIDVGEYPIEGYVVKDGYIYLPIVKSEPGEKYKSEYRKFDKRAFEKIDEDANYLVVKFKETWEVTKPRLIKKLYLVHIPTK